MSGREAGFSLLEVLVAFSITAVAVGILFQIYAKGSIASHLAGNYTEALTIAESKLADASILQAEGALELPGRALEKYDWVVRIQEPATGIRDEDVSTPFVLVSIDVSVSWRSRGKLHQVALQTLKPVTKR